MRRGALQGGAATRMRNGFASVELLRPLVRWRRLGPSTSGGYRDRTGDLYAASVALSQLS